MAERSVGPVDSAALPMDLPEALQVKTGTHRATAMTTSAFVSAVRGGTSTESAGTRETSNEEVETTETTEATRMSPGASGSTRPQRNLRARRSAARRPIQETETTETETSGLVRQHGLHLLLPPWREPHPQYRARATVAETAVTENRTETAAVEIVAIGVTVTASPASEGIEEIPTEETAAAARIIEETRVTLTETILVDSLICVM